MLCHNRLPTLHRLASFGIDLLQHCYLCVGGVETTTHLFLSCSYSSYVLTSLANLLSINFPVHTHCWTDMLASWGTILKPSLQLLALLAAQIFCYFIWKERNARVHDKNCFGPAQLLELIIRDLKTKLYSSSWFLKHISTDLNTSGLDF